MLEADLDKMQHPKLLPLKLSYINFMNCYYEKNIYYTRAGIDNNTMHYK